MDKDVEQKNFTTSTLGDLRDLSYKHLTTMRSFDQIESRTGVLRNVDFPILKGLENMAAAKKLEILKRDTGPNAHASSQAHEAWTFDVFSEEKQKIYKVKMVRKWTGVTCELLETDGVTLVLFVVVHNKGFACCSNTVVTVNHEKNVLLGSVIFRGDDAVLYRSDGNKTLRILTRTIEADHVEHAMFKLTIQKLDMSV